MNINKVARVAKTVAGIAKSKDPGAAAGAVVSNGLKVLHPVVGGIAGGLAGKLTEKAVNKGIEFAKDPAVQAKAKEIGAAAVKTGANAAASGARAVRRGVGTAAKKMQAFRAGHGK